MIKVSQNRLGFSDLHNICLRSFRTKRHEPYHRQRESTLESLSGMDHKKLRNHIKEGTIQSVVLSVITGAEFSLEFECLSLWKWLIELGWIWKIGRRDHGRIWVYRKLESCISILQCNWEGCESKICIWEGIDNGKQMRSAYTNPLPLFYIKTWLIGRQVYLTKSTKLDCELHDPSQLFHSYILAIYQLGPAPMPKTIELKRLLVSLAVSDDNRGSSG